MIWKKISKALAKTSKTLAKTSKLTKHKIRKTPQILKILLSVFPQFNLNSNRISMISITMVEIADVMTFKLVAGQT